MHDRFKKRIEMLSKEREQALFRSLAALADTFEAVEDYPPVLAHALRQLAWALAACSAEEQGQLAKLRLLQATLPILNDIMSAAASRHWSEVAALLKSTSSLLADATALSETAGDKDWNTNPAGRSPA